jgi:hypothetical protein
MICIVRRLNVETEFRLLSEGVRAHSLDVIEPYFMGGRLVERDWPVEKEYGDGRRCWPRELAVAAERHSANTEGGESG